MTNKPPIRIYVNKIENKITFKNETRYYLRHLTPKTMKLLESTKNKLTKDENGKMVPYLGIIEAVLIHCNFVNNGYQHGS